MAVTALLAAASLAIFLVGLVDERRRELATIRAIGASGAHLRQLIIGELALVVVPGVIGGLVLGLGIGEVLISVLFAMFDPPPTSVAIAPSYLLGLMLTLLAAVPFSAFLGLWRAGHQPIVESLRTL